MQTREVARARIGITRSTGTGLHEDRQKHATRHRKMSGLTELNGRSVV